MTSNIKIGETEKARDDYSKAIDAYFKAYSLSRNPADRKHVCEAISIGIEQGKRQKLVDIEFIVTSFIQFCQQFDEAF